MYDFVEISLVAIKGSYLYKHPLYEININIDLFLERTLIVSYREINKQCLLEKFFS